MLSVDETKTEIRHIEFVEAPAVNTDPDLKRSFHQLLREIGPGRIRSTAYDTAWVASLGELDEQLSQPALKWLSDNQLADGSWGTSAPFYYHDRIICTLAAMVALSKRGRRAQDRRRIDRGRWALERLAQRAPQGVMTDDTQGATIGFEMLVPALVAEAVSLGVIQHHGDDILGRSIQLRSAKLAKLKGCKINRFTSMAFSAEMLGTDKQELLDVENLREANGSSGHSPSATAYFAIHVSPGDQSSLDYLHSVVAPDGGVPNVAPFDVFEQAWALWNLSLTGSVDSETLALCQPYLDFIQAAWKPGAGVGFAAGYTPKDGDDSGIAYEVLQRYGRSVDIETILQYEREDHFNCYALEVNPSLSANIHILGALRQAGLDARHPSVQKVLRFLEKTQMAGSFWFDKWHSSPYYASSHAVIACAGYADEIAQNTVDWMLATQGIDGAWGYYIPTAEETAYCLQALVLWRRQGGQVPLEALQRGAAWLAEYAQPPYPALWMGKCLYCPELVIRSAVLSALTLVAQER